MRVLAKKRRREKKTNYLKRKRLLESGKARIVIRKTNKYIIIQYIVSKVAQDKVKYMISSKELIKYGWPKEKSGSLKNLSASYLTGLLFAKKIKDEDKKANVIFDTGLIKTTSGSRIYAALTGIVEGGVKIKHSAKVLIDEKKLVNDKTKDFFSKIKNKISGGSK